MKSLLLDDKIRASQYTWIFNKAWRVESSRVHRYSRTLKVNFALLDPLMNKHQEIIADQMVGEVTTIFDSIADRFYLPQFIKDISERRTLVLATAARSQRAIVSKEHVRRRELFRIHKLCSSISYPSRTNRPLRQRHDWFSPYPTYGLPLANEKSHLDVIRNSDPVITPPRLARPLARCFSSERAP